SPSGPPRYVTRDRLLEGTSGHEHAREGERDDLEQVDRITEPCSQVGADAGQAHRTTDHRYEDEPEPKASPRGPEAADRDAVVLQALDQGPRAGGRDRARRVSHRGGSSAPYTPCGRAPTGRRS